MQHFIQILQTISTWPFAFIFGLCILYRPINLLFNRIVESNTAKAKLGFVELEIGELAKKGKEAVDNFNELTIVMAKTRLLELEITKENFSTVFSSSQQVNLNALMLELDKKINYLEGKRSEDLSLEK
ncbi:hypothetical protein [Leclercia sp.]|uniref:hypothetical protein n=1 Tax=Leclercia sp. TaxID=1898428 RepID=UPI0028AC7CC2|nr:hypothetical protein [Leclercia sp.]